MQEIPFFSKTHDTFFADLFVLNTFKYVGIPLKKFIATVS